MQGESETWHIDDAARRHGVDDEDMLHAARNAIRSRLQEDGLEMLVGARRAGQPLEIGIAVHGDRITIVHAMPARPKFLL